MFWVLFTKDCLILFASLLCSHVSSFSAHLSFLFTHSGRCKCLCTYYFHPCVRLWLSFILCTVRSIPLLGRAFPGLRWELSAPSPVVLQNALWRLRGCPASAARSPAAWLCGRGALLTGLKEIFDEKNRKILDISSSEQLWRSSHP